CTARAVSATGRLISRPPRAPASTCFLLGLSQTTFACVHTSGNRPEIVPVYGSPLAMNRQCGGGSRPALQRLRGNRQTAVPVLIEGPGELTRDGTRYKDIVVGELRFRVHLEVLIADIASSDERYCVVGD